MNGHAISFKYSAFCAHELPFLPVYTLSFNANFRVFLNGFKFVVLRKLNVDWDKTGVM